MLQSCLGRWFRRRQLQRQLDEEQEELLNNNEDQSGPDFVLAMLEKDGQPTEEGRLDA